MQLWHFFYCLKHEFVDALQTLYIVISLKCNLKIAPSQSESERKRFSGRAEAKKKSFKLMKIPLLGFQIFNLVQWKNKRFKNRQ